MTEVETRIQPHNIEAEQAILGALLLNNDVIDRLGNLQVEHFYDPVHGRIFEKATQHIAKGALCSPVTLKPFFTEDEGLAELGGTDYLARIAGAAISIVAAVDYAKSIIDLANRRRLIRIGEEMQGRACDFSEDVEIDDMLAEVETDLLSLSEDAETTPNISFAKAAEIAANRMNAAFCDQKIEGIDLRIPELTALIGPARAGDIILLGGRPSMGKSAVAAEIALRCAEDGVGVVYWCGEMRGEDNAERMLSSAVSRKGARVAYNDAAAGKMTEDEFKAILETARDLEALPITFIDSAHRRQDRVHHEIRKEVKRLRKRGFQDVLIVVDYLQMIEGLGRSRYDEVTAISSGLKGLAMELKAPALVLSQLSRKVEDRDDKRPRLADLRESGQIEQDAQTVVFWYRDDYYLERAKPTQDDEGYSAFIAVLEKSRGKAELIVAKQRSGPLGTAHVRFDAATNRVMPWREVGGYADENQREFAV